MSPKMPKIRQVFIGNIVSSSPDRTLSINEKSVLGVDADGIIRHFEGEETDASKALLESAQTDWSLMVHRISEEKDGQGHLMGFLLPGFVDTHIHAPQLLNVGTALDKPLMEWLEHYTFKSESRIDADPEGLGARVYKKLVERMIEAGTTTASVYGTLTVEANLVLARAFQDAGIRAHIGKVAMDLNGHESYIETTAEALSRTSEFITAMEALTAPLEPHRRLVEPVITPRFVPTCSKELLVGLAEIAKTTGLRIQSHMSEAADQVEWSKSMWDGQPDHAVFDSLNLLTSKTLMAHCTHLSAPTLSLLATRGVSIAHCPLSNIYFSPEQSFPLVQALDAGVQVGLGSDVSGGYRIGIDDGMRSAVGVSRIRSGVTPIGDEKKERAVGWKESLYLATLGGAKAMGMDAKCGSFEVGKAFDAQLIRMGSKGSKIDLFDEEMPVEEVLEKWWCLGTEVDRVGVWVQGVTVRMVE
ncbi:guanine deaminase, partial [Phenoliferia sp. Uapishka_3]